MPCFAFIVHPLEKRNITSRPKYWWMKYLPMWLIEAIMTFKRPSVLEPWSDPIYPNGDKSQNGVEGFFVGVPMTGRMLKRWPLWFTNKRLLQAINLALRHGANVVGLGALTACVGDAGVTLNRHSPIPVTTGNSLTVGMAIEASERLTDELFGHIKPQERVLAVVGATGAIGQTCARLLAPQFGQIILVVKDVDKGLHAARQLGLKKQAYFVTTDTRHLKEAHVIISVTSADKPVIHSQDIAPGTLIIDVARPRDVALEMESRRDVLVVEGGVVEVPGKPSLGLDFGFPDGLVYACMAETMLLAMEGLDNGGRYRAFTIGKDVSPHQVEVINLMALRAGFKLAGYRSFERIVDDILVLSFAPFAGQRRPWIGSVSIPIE